MPKWTVVIEGRELPARPLVLEAAGVPPNDPTNSHQAIALLTQQGFEVRYQGKQIDSRREAQRVTDETSAAYEDRARAEIRSWRRRSMSAEAKND
jgi:hypothetical protein